MRIPRYHIPNQDTEGSMSNRHKIVFAASFVLAIFFSVPWIALIEQLHLAGSNIYNLPLGSRVTFLFFTVLFSSITFFYANLFLRKRLRPRKAILKKLVVTLANVLLILIMSSIMIVIAYCVFGISAPAAYFTFYIFRNFSIAIIVILIVYVIDLIDKLRKEKIDSLILQNRNTEMELVVLRNQVDPHFLFNTLATLSSLAHGNNKETIPFIDHLADSLRYMLEKRERMVATVEEELHFLESYLFMMKRRFGDGIHIDIRIDNAHQRQTIPQFALQIAIENAIKHNVVSSKHVLNISLASYPDHIVVINSVRRKSISGGYGIGLDNLAQRYWLLGQKKIRINHTDDSFTLTLPLL